MVTRNSLCEFLGLSSQKTRRKSFFKSVPLPHLLEQHPTALSLDRLEIGKYALALLSCDHLGFMLRISLGLIEALSGIRNIGVFVARHLLGIDRVERGDFT